MISLHSLMSHQIGATSSTLFAQMVKLIVLVRLWIAIHMAKEHTPIFPAWTMALDRDKRTNRSARKFAVGTSGNVESIVTVFVCLGRPLVSFIRRERPRVGLHKNRQA